MKTRLLFTLLIGICLSFSSFAQDYSQYPGQRGRRTPEERVARRLEKKARLAGMSHRERKAFKRARREHRRQKWARMSPRKRARMQAHLQARRDRRMNRYPY